jgi:hypothetical protein
MAQDTNRIEVYLEVGKTRTFAVALDWPGWCRSGRDEVSALQTLCEYGPRYTRALQTMQLSFHAPSEAADLVVVEWLTGNTTTNFGAPNLALSRDTKPIDPTELQHFQMVLKACWKTFDMAAQVATGRVLRKGPAAVDGIWQRSFSMCGTSTLLTQKASAESHSQAMKRIQARH